MAKTPPNWYAYSRHEGDNLRPDAITTLGELTPGTLVVAAQLYEISGSENLITLETGRIALVKSGLAYRIDGGPSVKRSGYDVHVPVTAFDEKGEATGKASYLVPRSYGLLADGEMSNPSGYREGLIRVSAGASGSTAKELGVAQGHINGDNGYTTCYMLGHCAVVRDVDLPILFPDLGQ